MRLNVKGSLLLMLCIIITTIFYCILYDPKPSIHDLVSETHRQLSNLKDVVVPEQENDRIKVERCEKYLRALGFTDRPRLFPTSVLSNVTLPVFVTAIQSDDVSIAIGFIKSFMDFVIDGTLIIYDLGLDDYEINLISKVCNSSSLSPSPSPSASSPSPNTAICSLRKFNFDIFPSHVSDLKIFAFRPIILQQVMDETGAALWLDPHYYLLQSANDKTTQLVHSALKVGIMSWTIDSPTSSLTHPRMFDYFKTSCDKYFFHRMIKPNHIVLYNTQRIHNDLMLPWVKCALTPECIAPIGAQSSGCRFDKKPFFRYSGCHNYDASALNVVLGVMFNYDEKPYSAAENDKFFRKITFEEANDIFSDDDSKMDYGGGKLRKNDTVSALQKLVMHSLEKNKSALN